MSVVAGVGAVRFGCLTTFIISETQESLEYEIVQLQNMIGCWRDSIFLTISLFSAIQISLRVYNVSG